MEDLEQMSMSAQVQNLGKIISREKYVKGHSQNSWTTGEGQDGHSSKAEMITEYTPVYAYKYNFNKQERKDAINKLNIIKDSSPNPAIKLEVDAQFANAKKNQEEYVRDIIGKGIMGIYIGGIITGIIATYGYFAWRIYDAVNKAHP